MDDIKLISALQSTGLLIINGSACAKCLSDPKIAAISIIAGAALSALINFISIKHFTRKDTASINIGTALTVLLYI